MCAHNPVLLMPYFWVSGFDRLYAGWCTQMLPTECSLVLHLNPTWPSMPVPAELHMLGVAALLVHEYFLLLILALVFCHVWCLWDLTSLLPCWCSQLHICSYSQLLLQFLIHLQGGHAICLAFAHSLCVSSISQSFCPSLMPLNAHMARLFIYC